MNLKSKTVSLAIVTSVNDEKVYHTNLSASPMLREGRTPLIVERGHFCAGAAYNAGMLRTDADIIIFSHQDVYLPMGWKKKLLDILTRITLSDKKWGVLGVVGISITGQGVGHVYSTGLRCFVGKPFDDPIRVRTLDEMVLITRRSSGLHFDERLPGFHLYGTDICLEAETLGMRNYVIPCFALHNSMGIKILPLSFWKAYMFLRNKWRNLLPITTPCIKITGEFSPLIKYFLTTGWSLLQGNGNVGSRVTDPERFYNEHLAHTVSQSHAFPFA